MKLNIEFESTSESVAEGHPDKLCDQIADAVLDEYLKKDPNSHVACEVMATANKVIISGEINSQHKLSDKDIQEIARQTIKEVGYTEEFDYDYKTIPIEVLLNQQSEEINKAVRKKDKIAAGDQGIMFGYATDETEELMPLPIILAHKLLKRAAELRKKGILPYLGPDGKSQLTVKYVNGKPKEVTKLILSLQHTKDVLLQSGKLSEDFEEDLTERVVKPVLGDYFTNNTRMRINPSGSFTLGGPKADTGLTGRKIIVDTYGGCAPHGGGAFSGKDPTKVDRSAAYMLRYIAKNIVKAGIAKECLIQVAYCIGDEDPVSISVNTFGTGIISDEKIIKLIQKTFSLKVADIIKKLKLTTPIYKHTACYGHFGRTDKNFSWESTDSTEELIHNLKKI